MYSETDQDTRLVWLDRACSRIINESRIEVPVSIALEEEADEFRDEVVVACLVLEHKLRMSEKARAVSTGTNLAWQGSGGYIM